MPARAAASARWCWRWSCSPTWRCWCCSHCRCSWRAPSSALDAAVSAERCSCASPGKSAGPSPSGCWSASMFALYLRYIGREVTLVLLAVCALLSQVGTAQQFQPLLAALAAGVVIENLAVRRATRCEPPCAAARRRCWWCSSSRWGRRCASTRWPRSALMRARRCRPSGSASSGSACDRRPDVGLGRARSAATRGPDWCRRPASRWGCRRRRRRVPDWGKQVQVLVVGALDRDPRAGRPRAVPLRSGRGRRARRAAPRPLMVVSNREPYLHNAAADGRIVVTRRDRRRRRGAGRADARTGRRVDRARRRHRRPAGRRRGRQGARAPREPDLRPAPAVARGAGVLGLLRRLRERGPVAAVPRGGRASEVSQRGLGAPIRTSTRGSRAAMHEELGDSRRAGVHPGLPPGPGRAGAARLQARRAHGALLAHSLALSRSSAHLSVAPRAAGRPARQRPDRLPARARPAQLPAGRRGRTRRRGGRRGVARHGATGATARSCRCRSAWTTTAFSAWRPMRRCRPKQRA